MGVNERIFANDPFVFHPTVRRMRSGMQLLILAKNSEVENVLHSTKMHLP